MSIFLQAHLTSCLGEGPGCPSDAARSLTAEMQTVCKGRIHKKKRRITRTLVLKLVSRRTKDRHAEIRRRCSSTSSRPDNASLPSPQPPARRRPQLAQVVLLCLSNRLDFFPLPIWDTDDDPARPHSPSWLWAMGEGRRRLTMGRRGREEGFRLEQAGDDFVLVSYPSPEGWRCAVEVHRFLVSVKIDRFPLLHVFFVHTHGSCFLVGAPFALFRLCHVDMRVSVVFRRVSSLSFWAFPMMTCICTTEKRRHTIWLASEKSGYVCQSKLHLTLAACHTKTNSGPKCGSPFSLTCQWPVCC